MHCANIKTELGYSLERPQFTLEGRRKLGASVEKLLKGEKEAAKAPTADELKSSQ